MLSWEEHGEAQLGAKWVDAQNTFFKKIGELGEVEYTCSHWGLGPRIA